MYRLAKSAHIYFETETGKWSNAALARFRDALDDITSASSELDPAKASLHVNAAGEHLAEILGETVQQAAMLVLQQVDSLRKWHWLRRLFWKSMSYRDFIEKQDVIKDYLIAGRLQKGALTAVELRGAHDSFVRAYELACNLRTDLRVANKDKRAWAVFALWCAPILIGWWLGG